MRSLSVSISIRVAALLSNRTDVASAEHHVVGTAVR
jgi:hypothetical protein